MARRKEAGQALAFTAFALVMLMGFVGLGVDMGMLRHDKRIQQTAADAAAIAGATNLKAGSSVTQGAYDAAQANGFADTGTSCSGTCPSSGALGYVTVTVNYSASGCTGPCSGPHTGNNKYVEVLVSAVQPTYFMKILGINTEVVTARAVATNVSGGGPDTGCVYTLGPPTANIEGININGHPTLNATTCGIVDNGNFNTSGKALTVNAGTFGVAGSWDGCTTGCSLGGGSGEVTCAAQSSTNCPAMNMPAGADPIKASGITAPANPGPPTGCISPCNYTATGTSTIQPGEYSSLTFSKNSITTLSPGIYYIDSSAGLTFGGGGSISGSGVMFYFTNGATFNGTGGGNTLDVNVTAPTSGTYAGILMYQNPSDTASPSVGGDNCSNFGGALYFPTVQITFFGDNKTNNNCTGGVSSTSYGVGMIIADALHFSGNPTINLAGAAGLPTGASFLTHPLLVE